MALTRQKKAEKVTELAKELEGSSSAIVGTFAKLTVAQDYNLRKVVREAGGKYRVLKNKLAARAAKGTQVEAALQGLKGVSSVAYTSGDPVALTKAISTWVTDNAEFTFKLGIVDGKVISIEEIKQLATMPGREELFSKLLFLINAPAQRLATVIAATGRDLAVVVNQAVEQNKFAGAAAPAEEAKVAPAPEAAAAPAAETAAPAAAEPSAITAEPSVITEGAAPDVTGAPQADPAQPETGEASQAQSASTEAPAEG
jgi:large subunit ribosomal protein L10